MTGIPVLHELEQVISGVEVDRLGYLGRVTIDMKMLFCPSVIALINDMLASRRRMPILESLNGIPCTVAARGLIKPDTRNW